jgi:hypothetical protein
MNFYSARFPKTAWPLIGGGWRRTAGAGAVLGPPVIMRISPDGTSSDAAIQKTRAETQVAPAQQCGQASLETSSRCCGGGTAFLPA